jgi:hypothetical protein
MPINPCIAGDFSSSLQSGIALPSHSLLNAGKLFGPSTSTSNKVPCAADPPLDFSVTAPQIFFAGTTAAGAPVFFAGAFVCAHKPAAIAITAKITAGIRRKMHTKVMLAA